MASVTKKTVTVSKPVQETHVVLELTEEEANYLAALTGMKVIGSSTLNEAIHKALYSAGYDYFKTSQAKEFSNKMSGQVRFDG